MPLSAATAPNPVALAWGVLLSGSLVAWIRVLGRSIRGHSLLPPPSAARAPWGAGSILIVLLAYVLLTQFVMITYSRQVGRQGLEASLVASGPEVPRPPPWTARDLLIINGLIQGSLIVLLPVVLRISSGARLLDLGFHRREWLRNVGRGLVTCALVAPGCYLMMAALSRVSPGPEHPVVEMLRHERSVAVLMLAVVTAVVLAPIFEELLFRGILLGWMATALERAADGRFAAGPESDESGVALPLPLSSRESREAGSALRALPAVLTSALFALMHRGQGPAPIPLFFLALALAHLARRTGSLWAPIALHAAFNGVSTLLLILGLTGAGAGPHSPELPPPAAQILTWSESKEEKLRNLAVFLLGGRGVVN